MFTYSKSVYIISLVLFLPYLAFSETISVGNARKICYVETESEIISALADPAVMRVVPMLPYTLTAPLIIPTGKEYAPIPGAVVKTGPENTLTFASGSHLVDNGCRIFDCAPGKVLGLRCTVTPEMFGGGSCASGSENSNALLAALDALGGNGGGEIRWQKGKYQYGSKVSLGTAMTKYRRKNLRLIGQDTTITTDGSVSDYIWELTGDITYQHKLLHIEGFNCNLNGAKGFLNINRGAFNSVIKNIFIEDSTHTANTIAVNITNCFGIILDNVVIYNTNLGSGTGVRVAADSGPGFNSPTNIALYNCIVQRMWRCYDFDIATSATTLKMVNCAAQGISGGYAEQQIGIRLNGKVLDNVSIDGCHLEHFHNTKGTPTSSSSRGIFLSTTERANLTIKNCKFYNNQTAWWFTGPGISVTSEGNRFTGTKQSQLFKIIGYNDGVITCVDRIDSKSSNSTYCLYIGEPGFYPGAGVIRNATHTQVPQRAN
ncbi:MAG: hypothetical protein A2020_09840 [Lentisphaerae bacterium GWF2_45_14]|nr:MAG: hypothetical protein A2020_09840 [Lentisphaerae bacterium GWF2_45_14]